MLEIYSNTEGKSVQLASQVLQFSDAQFQPDRAAVWRHLLAAVFTV